MQNGNNPFLLEKEEYQRDLMFLKHYVEDAAKYLSISTGDPIEKCTKFVKDVLKPGGAFEFKDPKIVYLERIDYADRVKKEGTLLQYLADSIKNEELIAPTLTTYVNPKVKKSLLVDFVDENIAIRSRAKKEMFTAKMKGLIDLESFKNAEQSNAKISNNSISGGHVSSSTVLFNKTAHSTLTSNCRSTSGYGNANNEKLLSGNRHYYHPSIVINNIVSIANRTDLVKLEAVMTKYQLHYPTTQEAMQCVLISTRQYWRSSKQEKVIEELLQNLKPLERAAFVYVSDFFQLALFNDSFMRTLVDRLATPVYGKHPDPMSVIKKDRKEHVMLAASLIPNVMRGVKWDELSLKVDETKDPEKEAHRILTETIICGHLANTTAHISKVVLEYTDFIEALLGTINVPPSLAFFPTSIRKSALTSDTDSTIFTVQDWVKWKTGELVVNDHSNAVAAVMVFLAAESVAHILANMSANFGIESKRIHTVNMKNEFFFTVFTPTQVGKHYFAYIGAQEGNIFIEYDMEIKGVHLKSSNVPKQVMKKAEEMMREIMDTVAAGKQFSIADKLNEIATIEREITRSVLAGENTYLRSQQIQTADSYTKEEEESPYAHYLFWERIFAEKYGSVDEPPYGVYKVPVRLPNARGIKQWLEDMQDPVIKSRLIKHFADTGRKSLRTMMLPQSRLAAHGIPTEILPVLDIRRTILDMCSVFYIILECFNVGFLDKKISQLISDYH